MREQLPLYTWVHVEISWGSSGRRETAGTSWSQLDSDAHREWALCSRGQSAGDNQPCQLWEERFSHRLLLCTSVSETESNTVGQCLGMLVFPLCLETQPV